MDDAHMIEMNPRRYKIMEVAPDVIANLASGTFRVTAGKLPEGTRIVSRCYDSRRDTFQLILEHESFEPVVPGGEIPLAEGVFIRRIDAPANCPCCKDVTQFAHDLAMYLHDTGRLKNSVSPVEVARVIDARPWED